MMIKTFSILNSLRLSNTFQITTLNQILLVQIPFIFTQVSLNTPQISLVPHKSVEIWVRATQTHSRPNLTQTHSRPNLVQTQPRPDPLRPSPDPT